MYNLQYIIHVFLITKHFASPLHYLMNQFPASRQRHPVYTLLPIQPALHIMLCKTGSVPIRRNPIRRNANPNPNPNP